MSQRMISGSVNANGSIEGGKGFIITPLESGVYEIIFEQRFNSFPTLVVTENYPGWDYGGSHGDTRDNAVIAGLSDSYAIVVTGVSSGKARPRNFCFIAMGE